MAELKPKDEAVTGNFGSNTEGGIPTIPDWETYSHDPIFANVADLNLFDVTVEIPKIFNLGNSEVTYLLGDCILKEVEEALRGAQFYALEDLHRIQGDRRIGVSYDDDELGFEVFIDSDGDLRLIRRGSSFARFHAWYTRFMPSADSLVSRILEDMRGLASAGFASGTSRSSGIGLRQLAPPGSAQVADIKPVRASYAFQFIAYDFTQPPSDEVQRNFLIMRNLLGRMPGPDGHLDRDLRKEISPEDAALYGRLDYRVGLWARHADTWARDTFSVEAPGNRRFSTVWFTFSHTGETKKNQDGSRNEFDFSSFLKYYEIPYVTFLQRAALQGFLRDLTRGMVFKTTAGNLP
jgi:hypothetical protein